MKKKNIIFLYKTTVSAFKLGETNFLNIIRQSYWYFKEGLYFEKEGEIEDAKESYKKAYLCLDYNTEGMRSLQWALKKFYREKEDF